MKENAFRIHNPRLLYVIDTIFYQLVFCHLQQNCMLQCSYFAVNMIYSSLAGSFSRSAVNYMAGCQTAVSNIVMSVVVFLTLMFLTPLFEYTPNAILSAIIISAVIGLIDYDAAILIWKIDKFDFVACMGAFFGVVFASVEIGLLIAVRMDSVHISLCFHFFFPLNVSQESKVI